jgi:hypothetical protein
MDTSWQTLAAASGSLLLTVYLLWRTVETCRRFNLWLLPLVLLLDASFFFLAPLGFGFLVWKLWFFWATFRWEPVRGLFRLPRWPRTPFTRGPGKRRPREFREPLPWTAGPCSK